MTRPLELDLAEILAAVKTERAALQLVAGVLGNLPVGVALHDADDADFRVLYLNQMAAAFVSGVEGPLLGMPFREVYLRAGQGGLVDLMDQVRHTGATGSLHNYSSEGGHTWNIDVHPITAALATKRCLLVVAQDISEGACWARSKSSAGWSRTCSSAPGWRAAPPPPRRAGSTWSRSYGTSSPGRSPGRC